uniref:Uncharacterized protein n=1 Tax=Oryza rufipogon TaxID=4529 RepID=A0A0E0PY14_ORYRU
MSVNVCGNVLFRVNQLNVLLFFLETSYFAFRKAKSRLCISMLVSLMLKGVDMMYEGVAEIVPLRKVCRRPETDYRLQILHAARAAGMAKEAVVDLVSHNDKSSAEQKPPKQHKMMDVNTDEVTMVSNQDQEEPTGKPAATLPAAPVKTLNDSASASASDVQMGEAQAAPKVESSDEVEDKMKEG